MAFSRSAMVRMGGRDADAAGDQHVVAAAFVDAEQVLGPPAARCRPPSEHVAEVAYRCRGRLLAAPPPGSSGGPSGRRARYQPEAPAIRSTMRPPSRPSSGSVGRIGQHQPHQAVALAPPPAPASAG